MIVSQILSYKGSDIVSVPSSITVYDAIKVMGEKNIGSVLIIEDSKLKGILSERDYARKIVLNGKSSRDTMVHEIMDTDLITVTPHDDIHFCMQLMTQKRVRHLPVLEDDKVTGILSMGDVLIAIIELQKDTIDHLDSYISGKKS